MNFRFCYLRFAIGRWARRRPVVPSRTASNQIKPLFRSATVSVAATNNLPQPSSMPRHRVREYCYGPEGRAPQTPNPTTSNQFYLLKPHVFSESAVFAGLYRFLSVFRADIFCPMARPKSGQNPRKSGQVRGRPAKSGLARGEGVNGIYDLRCTIYALEKP